MTNAVVLIEAERDALSTLGGALADIDGVAEAYSVTGEWDFVAIVRVPDHEQLADVVTGEIGGAVGRAAHADDGRVRGLLAPRPRSAVLDRRIDRARDGGGADEAGVRPDARAAARAALARCLAAAARARDRGGAWRCWRSLVGGGADAGERAATHTAGRVPFSFSYRGLYRVAPEPGGYVKVQSRGADGALKYSFAVEPLRAAAVRGRAVGRAAALRGGLHPRAARALRATSCCAARARRASTTRSGYQVALHGHGRRQQMYGRDVLLLPERARRARRRGRSRC